MKPNLWIVGDSYVMTNMKTKQWIDHTKGWPYLLGKSLDVDTTSVIGQYGCANTYICYEIKKNSIHMKPNDYLVVVTTSYTRKWFFFDEPQYTNAKVIFDNIDKKLKKAISKKTKWVILNSPSNPTGAGYTKKEIQDLAKVLIRNKKVYILSDDTVSYTHLTLPTNREV